MHVLIQEDSIPLLVQFVRLFLLVPWYTFLHGKWSDFFISRRALAREGDYKMHPVCAWVRVCALVCHADFSKTATATDFL